MKPFRDQMALLTSQVLKPYRDQMALLTSQDVLKAYRDEMALFKSQDVLTTYRDQMALFKSAEVSTRYRDQMRALVSQGVFEPYREALAFKPDVFRNLVRTATDDLRAEAHEQLTEIEDILREVPAEDPEPSTFEWLAWLPPIAQRRMFLLTLGVLLAAENTVYVIAEVEPPAHIDKIVVLLLLIASYLSELIEYSSSDDECPSR